MMAKNSSEFKEWLPDSAMRKSVPSVIAVRTSAKISPPLGL